MNLEQLQSECILEQKKGLHFILTSVIIWTVIAIIHITTLPMMTKNLLTFCATSLLVPISYALSKPLKIVFSNKENPLNKLGLILSMNQMLYLLIAMWVYANNPEKFIMVMAMIFGAHLLPFSWLYQSKTYAVMSFAITFTALIIGVLFQGYLVAIAMIAFEVLFSVLLIREVKNLKQS